MSKMHCVTFQPNILTICTFPQLAERWNSALRTVSSEQLCHRLFSFMPCSVDRMEKHLPNIKIAHIKDPGAYEWNAM